MIQMFCDGVLLYDPRSADYIVAEPKCELEVNKTGNRNTQTCIGQHRSSRSALRCHTGNSSVTTEECERRSKEYRNLSAGDQVEQQSTKTCH